MSNNNKNTSYNSYKKLKKNVKLPSKKEIGDVMPTKTANFIPDSPQISTSREGIPVAR